MHQSSGYDLDRHSNRRSGLTGRCECGGVLITMCLLHAGLSPVMQVSLRGIVGR